MRRGALPGMQGGERQGPQSPPDLQFIFKLQGDCNPVPLKGEPVPTAGDMIAFTIRSQVILKKKKQKKNSQEKSLGKEMHPNANSS